MVLSASWSRSRASPSLEPLNPLHHQRGVVAVRPFPHGAVVITCSLIAKKLQDEYSVRRTDAALSIGHNFFFRRCSDRLQHGPQLRGRLDGLVFVVRNEV